MEPADVRSHAQIQKVQLLLQHASHDHSAGASELHNRLKT